MSGLNLWPGNFFDGVCSFLLRQEQTEHRKTAVHSAQRSDQRGWDGRIHMTYWNQDRLNTESIIIHLCSTPVELWSQQKSSCSSSRVLEWQRERERTVHMLKEYYREIFSSYLVWSLICSALHDTQVMLRFNLFQRWWSRINHWRESLTLCKQPNFQANTFKLVEQNTTCSVIGSHCGR